MPLLGDLLQKALPSAQVVQIAPDPAPEDLQTVLQRAQRADQVVVGSLDPFRQPVQRQLLAELMEVLP